MIRRKAANTLEQIILDNVRRFGWHSNSVGTQIDTAIFAYTVGLFHSYGHPELLVFGLPPKTAHRIFSVAAKAARRGHTLDTAAPNDELLPGRSCVLVEVPKRRYTGIVDSALWFYGSTRFPLYQVVWPSGQGHYPWHPDAADSVVLAQPVLSHQPPRKF